MGGTIEEVSAALGRNKMRIGTLGTGFDCSSARCGKVKFGVIATSPVAMLSSRWKAGSERAVSTLEDGITAAPAPVSTLPSPRGRCERTARA